MLNTIKHIKETFYESIQTKTRAINLLADLIAQAGEMMVQCFLNEHKIMSCGNGGSAADAQHFSAELLNRFSLNRRPLPAIALTTDTSTLTSIGNDADFTQIFSKQVDALALSGDILLAISTSGQSKNVILAVEAAHQKRAHVIALTGEDGGMLTQQLHKKDINICVPSTNTARIQETHVLVIHCWCDIIEQTLFNTNK